MQQGVDHDPPHIDGIDELVASNRNGTIGTEFGITETATSLAEHSERISHVADALSQCGRVGR
jgi:hypothetical protein